MMTMSRTARMCWGLARRGYPARYRFIPPQTREVPGKMAPRAAVLTRFPYANRCPLRSKTRWNGTFTVLDLTLGRTVNGADCRPDFHPVNGRNGAIAQLGERVVRNDEVGGSIPPGSTTLRPSGFAWRSH